jgi:hypothetical protein
MLNTWKYYILILGWIKQGLKIKLRKHNEGVGINNAEIPLPHHPYHIVDQSP